MKQLGGSPGAGLPRVFQQSQFVFVLLCGLGWEGEVGLVGNTPAPALSPLCVRWVCTALRSTECLCGCVLKGHSLNLTFKPLSSLPAEVKQRWLNCEPGVLCGSNKP